MADIKTRDRLRGTIKTIDKAYVAGQHMKRAYISTRIKPNTAHILTKTRLMNMLRTDLSKELIQLSMKVSD